MTTQEKQRLIDYINQLEGEEKQAAIDALQTILDARQSGGPGALPPEMEVEEDPDLIDPQSANRISQDDADIDDPDHVLDRKQHVHDEDEDEEENDEDNNSSSSSSSSSDSDSDDDNENKDDSENDEDSDENSSSSKANSKQNKKNNKNNKSSEDDKDESESSIDDDLKKKIDKLKKENEENGVNEFGEEEDSDDENNGKGQNDEDEDDSEGDSDGKDDESDSDSESDGDSDSDSDEEDSKSSKNKNNKNKNKSSEDSEDEDESDEWGGGGDDEWPDPTDEEDESDEEGSSGKDGDSEEDDSEEGDSEGDSDKDPFDNDDWPDPDSDDEDESGSQGDEEGDEEGDDDGDDGDDGDESGNDESDKKPDRSSDSSASGKDDLDSSHYNDPQADGSLNNHEDEEEKDDFSDLFNPEQDDEVDMSDETGLDAGAFADKEAEEQKRSEFFRRKITLERLRKAMERAKAMADNYQESVALTELDKNSAKKLASLDKLLQELEQQYAEDLNNGTPSDADDFNEKVNDIITGLEEETGRDVIQQTKDKDTRVKDLEAENNDPTANKELEDEDAENNRLSKELNQKKQKPKRKPMPAPTNVTGSMRQFKIDFEEAVREQVDIWDREYYQEFSYARVDRHHDDLVSPGEYEDMRFVPISERINIDCYIDQSGSWNDWHVEQVKQALASIKDLVYDENDNPDGKVVLNLHYMGEGVLSDDISVARSRANGLCWGLAMRDIKSEPMSKNVIFVTDHDIDRDDGVPGGHGVLYSTGVEAGATVEGYVWWIWRDNNYGGRSHIAPQKLKGLTGNKEYVLR